ncbi:cytochrome c biogenesis protein, transmembrane region [Psychromonas sp. CNPT3]|uniref:protein-disulfide reductase DsbD family protein n=1 Tax=Psychromonas sp. CNPT3 TaxID=314282 RepID=UPI00006E706A|nr:protein-disulfide reductase DsbD domain-containing protein [Psychromonas sp. CNPT3]AGH80067.1 cytochrome c biogenesis protein, transmembrane region [Psychromonas sp. CNPT3]
MAQRLIRAFSVFVVLFLSLGSAFLWASIEDKTATGWLIDAQHPSVAVSLQLTQQVNKTLQSVNAILDVTLENPWKTYWRSPGEGGVAPQFNWQTESTNIASVDWLWPTPKRYPVAGIETLGYKHQIHFPITIYLKDITQPAHLKGRLTLASCTNICVLSDYDIELIFDPTQLVFDANLAFTYAQALSQVPVQIKASAITDTKNKGIIQAFSGVWDQSKQQLIIRVSGQVDWKNVDLFTDILDEKYAHVFFSKPQIEVQGAQLIARFDASSWGGEVDISEAEIHSTIVDDNSAIEVSFIAKSGEDATSLEVKEDSAKSLFSIFLFALLGGLILNVMPCVLPVLGMKLSSILSSKGLHRGIIRKQFLASSFGIISSFWLIALFLLVLKFSGQALGWGIQFQSPYFIGFMVLITALFALNMLGFFEIQLPSKWQTWLALKGGNTYLGHYLQGMFATLLATPCSAPFLGTAIAYALGASSIELVAVFTALGLGMALPWLCIALFPQLALLLPKPGKWMSILKSFFAVMILLTCFWLLSLMVRFVGLSAILIIAILFLGLLGVLIFKKHGKKIFIMAFVASIFCIGSAFLLLNLSPKYGGSTLNKTLHWQVLNAQEISLQVSLGKTVFVDVTADWCVTCKANKLGVLLQQPVYSALQAENITLMQGDWTVRSNNITQYLQRYSRYGVPFNIVYGPNAPQGIELPTLLTSNLVLDALAQASKK